MTRIKQLTASNVRALEETHADAIASGNLRLGKTWAEWAVPATAALANLEGIASRLPARGHPRASLHAVARKLAKLADEQHARRDELVTEALGVAPGQTRVIGIGDLDQAKLDEAMDASGYVPLDSHPTDVPYSDVPASSNTTREEDQMNEEQQTGPAFDPACLYLLDQWSYDNLFESADASPGAFTFRCKGCREIVPPQSREAHYKNHKAQKESIMAAAPATTRKSSPKTTKPTAASQGFAPVYCAENGNFKPGFDARAKSDLINRVLDISDPKSILPADVDADAARKLIGTRGWDGFLARKQQIVETKATAAAAKASEKAEAARAKAEAKKTAKKDAKNAEAVAVEPVADEPVVEEPVVATEVTPDPKPTRKPRSNRRAKA